MTQPDRKEFRKLKGDARELATHRNDCPTFHAFWHRHAVLSKVAPSCLVCGKSMQGEQPAITHTELPNIVVCLSCRDNARR